MKMRKEQMISKMIHLDEQAKAHDCEYVRLSHTPGNKAKASFHNRKALKLRSRINDLMKRFAAGVFDKAGTWL